MGVYGWPSWWPRTSTMITAIAALAIGVTAGILLHDSVVEDTTGSPCPGSAVAGPAS